MLKKFFSNTLTMVLALLCAISVSAQNREVIRSGAEAEQAIKTGVIHDQIAGYEANLAQKGLQASKEAIFFGEKVVTDENGQSTRSKTILIPFTGVTGRIEATILLVVTEAEDGTIKQSFTIYSADPSVCDCGEPLPTLKLDNLPSSVGEITTESTAQTINTSAAAASAWDGFQQLVNMIRSRNWSGIRSWIYGRLAKGLADYALAEVVRYAFESNGYYCPSPPWWVPFKSIWYLVTCAGVAR